ncbi:MAG: Nucleoside-binding protein [Acetothermia bacterium 64_32]|nr:MAG: Nucleoside-binding protein [Acetothermia bacterium 64_32]HAF71427.1 BMP family ABC transporter substrate-binding protein [Candidatus Acetothermia bacterium]
MKRLACLGIAVFLGLFAFGQDIPKIGLILATGGLGDRSFNDQSYWGAERAAQELAARYEVSTKDVFSYVEPRSIADYEAFQREFARAGEYTIIVCIGFDQAPILEEVAPDYPDQKFVVIDAVAAADNVASIVFNDWEEAFLCGVVAGMLTNTGKVGVEGGMDIPLIRRFVQGYTQGAMWANPKITEDDVLVRYVGAWNNPTLGKELALEMYQAGADIIYGAAGKSHLGVFAAAEENPAWWALGTDVDQAWSAPEHADVIVASGLKRVDLAVYTEIMKAVEGTWSAGVISYGMVSDIGIGTGIAFGPWTINDYITASYSEAALPNSLVHEILTKLVEAVDGIMSGSIVIEHE